MDRIQFERLQKNDFSWARVQENVAFRKFRKFGDDVEATRKIERDDTIKAA